MKGMKKVQALISTEVAEQVERQLKIEGVNPKHFWGKAILLGIKELARRRQGEVKDGDES